MHYSTYTLYSPSQTSYSVREVRKHEVAVVTLPVNCVIYFTTTIINTRFFHKLFLIKMRFNWADSLIRYLSLKFLVILHGTHSNMTVSLGGHRLKICVGNDLSISLALSSMLVVCDVRESQKSGKCTETLFYSLYKNKTYNASIYLCGNYFARLSTNRP